MKTETQILETLEAIRAALPKCGPAPERVGVDGTRSPAGVLRVILARGPGLYDLIGEWGHGVCGWVPIESACHLSAEGRRVYNAAQKAMKANP